MNEYLYLICLAATGSSVQYNLLSITRAHKYIILKTLRKIILKGQTLPRKEIGGIITNLLGGPTAKGFSSRKNSSKRKPQF